MHCPFCNSADSVVKDSRIVDGGKSIRRRRSCNNCDSRFTTYEKVHLKEIIIIKKSGEREFFAKEKLLSSIRMAVRKRDIKAIELDNLVNSIINDLNEQTESEVESAFIGELVLKYLLDLDKVAYVRFASVYKNFRDTEDFEDFIRNLS